MVKIQYFITYYFPMISHLFPSLSVKSIIVKSAHFLFTSKNVVNCGKTVSINYVLHL